MTPTTYASHVKEIEAFGLGLPSPAQQRDRAVLSSWRRCIDRHRLDPAATCDAYIVPDGQLRVHREEAEALVRIARSGLERLYQQLAGLDYVLLLADRHGVTVDFLGHEATHEDLRRAGLYLGAEWREDRAGTSAVGACLETGEALTVHQSDHFDFTHTPLSCTAAPIYDLRGELTAVLDLSLLHAPAARASQSLALHLVNATARRIELSNLMERARNDWVLRFAQSPDFLDVDPEAAITVDARGRIRGMTHAGARALARAAGIEWRQRHRLLGQPLERFFELDIEHLPQLLRNRPAQERIVRARDGSVLFAHAIEPQRAVPRPTRAELPPPTRTTALPPPLQALSAGDAGMDAMLQRAARLARQDLPILIQGESGAGKEFLARALHEASGRSGPFVAINCAAIPEALLESELFGYLPGSWSGGSAQGRRGLIETAHEGTLFLDEIGDMPLSLQVKLLRVLSESEITPLGARAPKRLDLRIVSASHRALPELVAQGQFRHDLLYRLNAAVLQVPPLRARSDLDTLVAQMLHRLQPGSCIHAHAMARLRAYAWPGNLRELHNVLRHALALCDAPHRMPIGVAHLPETLQSPALEAPSGAAAWVGGSGVEPAHDRTPSPAPAAAHTPAGLEALLAHCHGNVSEVARLLGVSRSTVHRRIKRLQLGERHIRWHPRE